MWMIWWNLWAEIMLPPIEIEVTIRRPATAKVISFQAERAKRAARQAS